MGEIKVNTTEIEEAERLLKNAHYIMDAELATLKQVEELIGASWISNHTERLVSCVSAVQKKVRKTSEALDDLSNDLDFIIRRAKVTEALNSGTNFFKGGN